MRGYVLQGKGRGAWQEVPIPAIGPYDALVRPTAVATCTTHGPPDRNGRSAGGLGNGNRGTRRSGQWSRWEM